MQSAFEKEKKNGLEKLVEFQHEMEILTKIADEIFPFLKECFELDIQSLDFFNKIYLWAFRCYDGTYCYLSLQDIIDYEEYMYKTRKKIIRFKVEMKLFLHFLEKKFTTALV